MITILINTRLSSAEERRQRSCQTSRLPMLHCQSGNLHAASPSYEVPVPEQYPYQPCRSINRRRHPQYPSSTFPYTCPDTSFDVPQRSLSPCTSSLISFSHSRALLPMFLFLFVPARFGADLASFIPLNIVHAPQKRQKKSFNALAYPHSVILFNGTLILLLHL